MQGVLDVPHVHDVLGGPALTAALRQVGAEVLNRGDEGSIAVTTLHRHFEIPTGHALLDRVDLTAQEITTELVTTGEAESHQPVAWGFTPHGDKFVLGWSNGVPVDPQLEAAVDGTGKFLVREDLTTVLAIVRRQGPLSVGADQILLEQTDEAARTQRTTVTQRKNVPDELTAGWYFECDASLTRGTIRPEDVRLVAMRGCDPGC